MVRTISDYYSIIYQEEEGITVAKFDTKSGTGYRAYFYPLCDFSDKAEWPFAKKRGKRPAR